MSGSEGLEVVPLNDLFLMQPQKAIAFALADFEFVADQVASALQKAGEEHGYQFFSLTGLTAPNGAELLAPARIKPVFFRLPTELVPAYYLEVQVSDPSTVESDYYAYVVAAKNGKLLYRHSLKADAQSFNYRAWAEPMPPFTPYPGPQGRNGTPHPTGMPDSYQAPFVTPNLIGLQNAPFSKNDPWLLNNATETKGNNVDAYADIFGPDGFNNGDLRANTTTTNTFDLTYDVNQPPYVSIDQRKASVTQLFYTIDWLHDWFYDAGFNESAGNAQVNNYGRSGLGNDPIQAQAQAQDYSGLTNANMNTPADGGSPRMQMYVWNDYNTGVHRDSGLDAAIVAHEWGHYISNRLVHNSSGLTTNMSRGLGEGWGDFHALMLMVADAQDFSYGGVYAMGGYSTRVLTNNNFYFGIRRYPYSTNFSKNPLTFKHIQDGVALPAGVPVRANGIANSEVHNTGEIWANMLWGCYAGLLNDTPRLTFTEAQNRMKTYLVAAYKMTTTAPTLPEARDALLSVMDSQDHADSLLCAQSFAQRGAGAGAIAPDRYSTSNSGVTEGYGTSGAVEFLSVVLSDSPGYCDADGILDNEETGALSITLRNNGFAAFSSGSVALSSPNPGIFFPQNTVAIPTFSPGETVTLTAPITINGIVGIQPTNIILTANAPSFAAPFKHNVQFRMNMDELPNASKVDDFEGQTVQWARYLGATAPSNTSLKWQLVTLNAGGHAAWATNDTWALSYLRSPALQVSSIGNFSFTFKQRYQFEATGSYMWDGGVIEISTDTDYWTDIGAFAIPTYTGTLESSPLNGRPAYVNQNPQFPLYQTVTVDLGTAYQGQTVYIRFTLAADGYHKTFGWEVDDVEFSGIDNNPFSLTVPHQAHCHQLNVISGTPQSADMLTVFATPLKTQVKDFAGNPLSGINVTFTTPGNGASGTFAGGITSVIVTTGANGYAIAPPFTANGIAGTYNVTVTAGIQSVNYQMTNRFVDEIFSNDFE